MDIDDYIKQKCKGGNKPKTLAQKRQWLKEHDIKTVKHPKTGRDSIPVTEKTLMLTGTRVSATRSREEEFENRAEAKTSFSKMRANFEVAVNSKAIWLIGLLTYHCYQRCVESSWYVEAGICVCVLAVHL